MYIQNISYIRLDIGHLGLITYARYSMRSFLHLAVIPEVHLFSEDAMLAVISRGVSRAIVCSITLKGEGLISARARS